MQPIKEWHSVDRAIFENEISAANQPAVLRGLVNHWPAVAKANNSITDICNYITKFDLNIPAQVFLGAPEIKGRFWYSEDMTGFNFERKSEHLAITLERLITHMTDAEPPAIYAGSVPIWKVIPEFCAENTMPILGNLAQRRIEPRIWIGNQIKIQAHFDVAENVACVISGKRRFTLFPPEQLKNLYVGPLDFNMAGAPVSMVNFDNPDLTKHSNFPLARDAAYVAELGPGDAVYIPYMWWHHVESLTPFNMMVSYWWDSTNPDVGPALAALAHAILAVRSVPPEKREVWKQFFAHYVFECDGDPSAHLDLREKGILQPMSSQLSTYIKRWLVKVLSN